MLPPQFGLALLAALLALTFASHRSLLKVKLRTRRALLATTHVGMCLALVIPLVLVALPGQGTQPAQAAVACKPRPTPPTRSTG